MKVTRPRPRFDGPDVAGELPTSLLELYSGELLVDDSDLFASGVRTSSREQIQDYARGAGKGGAPLCWSVDVTYVNAPKFIVCIDLLRVQVCNIEHLLDSARVRAGDRVAEWPSVDGEIALRAAERGAGAKIITVSDDHTDTVSEQMEKAGLRGVIDVVQMDHSIPSPRGFESDLEAAISVGRLETPGRAGALRWPKSAERLSVDHGTIVVQMAVAAEKFGALAKCNLDPVRAYVWPQSQLFTMEELCKMVDRETGLRITTGECIPAHFAMTLQFQCDFFAAHAREVAGIGYDRVLRRIWNCYLSLFGTFVRAEKVTFI